MILGLTFILIVSSGVILWPVRGQLGPQNPVLNFEFWGCPYHDWRFLHAWGAVLMCLLIILHLAWHGKWIRGMIRARFKTGFSGDILFQGKIH